MFLFIAIWGIKTYFRIGSIRCSSIRTRAPQQGKGTRSCQGCTVLLHQTNEDLILLTFLFSRSLMKDQACLPLAQQSRMHMTRSLQAPSVHTTRWSEQRLRCVDDFLFFIFCFFSSNSSPFRPRRMLMPLLLLQPLVSLLKLIFFPNTNKPCFVIMKKKILSCRD